MREPENEAELRAAVERQAKILHRIAVTLRGAECCATDHATLPEEVGRERAEVRRLSRLLAAADEFGDRHVLNVRGDGWTLAHPLSCRAAGLFDCPVSTAANWMPARPYPVDGRFAVTVEDGHLVIGERVQSRTAGA